MEISLLLLTFAMFWKSCTSVQCYQCVAELTYTNLETKCDHFDGSEKFIVNCPDSSMCYKRVTEWEFGDGITTKSFHRGCASQTVDGDQKKINGKWQKVNDIYDVYDEDCKLDNTDADRIPNTLHCYCRGDLCNGSRKHYIHYSAVFTSVIVALVTT